MLVNWGLATTHFQVSMGHFFLRKPDVQVNLGHMSYLFTMWTKEEVQQLTTMQVIEKHFRLVDLKAHYQHQNLECPEDFLPDL